MYNRHFKFDQGLWYTAGTMKAKVQEKCYLIDILQSMSPDSSKNSLKTWIEKGRVLVDGSVVKKINLELKTGQHVEVGPKASFTDEGIKIVYEDRYLVVLDKPSTQQTEKT